MPDLRSAPTFLASAEDKSYKIFKQRPCLNRGHRFADCCWLLRCYGRCCWHTAVGAAAVAAGLGAVAAWVVLPAAAAAGAACCRAAAARGLRQAVAAKAAAAVYDGTLGDESPQSLLT